MRKHHPENERIKRLYLHYLEDAKRMKAESVDQAAAAIAAFEESTGWRDFRRFHIEQARKFKRDLDTHIVSATGKPLAVATKCSRLRAVKSFFQWLAGQPGYRSKLTYSDVEYFNPTNNEGRIAGAVRDRPVPSLEQIRHVLTCMPAATVIDRRNRALIAFTLLTGARDAAIASMSLKHVDLARRNVDQDARDVNTKNRKTFTTWFFPVGDDIEAIVAEWIGELRTGLHFGENDPLFPASARGLDANGYFCAAGLERRHWSDAGPIRRIFREAFEAAGVPNFHPHSFRKTIWKLGASVCRLGEEERAWSLNLGHDHVRTSRESYGPMTHDERETVLKRVSLRIARKDTQGLDPASLENAIAALRSLQAQNPV